MPVPKVRMVLVRSEVRSMVKTIRKARRVANLTSSKSTYPGIDESPKPTVLHAEYMCISAECVPMQGLVNISQPPENCLPTQVCKLYLP
jgi:hypothetical protein